MQHRGKATPHNSPERVILHRNIGCLMWDLNPYPSNFQVTLLPTGLGLGKTDRLRGKRGKVEQKKGKSREKWG